MVRQHRGARGRERCGQSREFIFTVDSFFDQNIVFGRIRRFFMYGIRVETRK